MRYQTDLMRSILTSNSAQKMIDYVSPRYGNSYVGLWLFEAMGRVLDEVCELGVQLRYEANPATSTLLLDLWEDHYKLARDPNLTVEQRRERLLAKMQSTGACNPARLAAAVSKALGGVEVDVTENISKNRFLVTVYDHIDSYDPAISVIERMKPAHQIYDIRVCIRTDLTENIKLAGAMTYAEKYTLHAIEYDEDPSLIYVIGVTLYANVPGITAVGTTATIAEGVASVEGKTLIIE